MQPLVQENRVGASLRSSLNLAKRGSGTDTPHSRAAPEAVAGAAARTARTRAADPGSGVGTPPRSRRPGEAWPAARPSARSRLRPTPTSRRRGSRPLTTHFLPRKVKRDSFSCGVSSRDPTLATLRGGGCWPELMVPPGAGSPGPSPPASGRARVPLGDRAGGGESQA